MKTKVQIRTASELKAAVESTGSYFFERATMRLFGDTMANYGVRQPVEVETITGERVMAYELFRRRPVKRGLKTPAYFHADTFARVFTAND